MRCTVSRHRRSIRGIVSAAVLLGFGLVVPNGLEGGQERQVFMALVDQSGTPVTDLDRDEIHVSEDGEPRDILRLEAIDWPMKLTILIDNGPSFQDASLHLRNGLRTMLEALPAGIETELLTLAPQPRWIVRPTRDHLELIDGVSRITPDGGAPKFIEGLMEVAERISEDDSNYFPAILIVGSNGPEGSAYVERDVNRMATRLYQRSTTMHVVMLGVGRGSVRSFGQNQLEIGIQMAEITGGRFENINLTSRLTTLLPELGEQIARSHLLQSQQYRITYDASGTPRPRRDDAVSPQVSATTTREGLSGFLTFDGHIP